MSMTGVPWLRWRHQAVRDLAWAMASPPLLTPVNESACWPGNDWCQQVWHDSRDWLSELDRDPAPLLQVLSARRDPRLGSYFEGLLAFWLASPANRRYRLIAGNLPVRAHRQTLGELDFLVEDRLQGEIQHWEVAVKFYLGVAADSGDAAGWIGPGQRDCLARKREHLTGQQLGLTREPAGQALLQDLGLPPATPVCLLKGRLFYPAAAGRETGLPPADANPLHLRGWWQHADDFASDPHRSALRWLKLPKPNWLTPVPDPDILAAALTREQLLELLAREAVPRAIAVIGVQDGREVTRGFVAPAGWPYRA